MPGAEDSGPGPYRLVYSDAVRGEVRRLGTAAVAAGAGQAFVTSLKVIEERLSLGPMEFGEPLRDLKHLELQVRTGGHGALFVRYAVDEERHLVYPLTFHLFGG